MNPQHDDPRLRGRPMWGLAILALPILLVILVAVAYTAMVFLGLAGRPARGERAAFVVSGCPEATDVVEARLTDMGLTVSRDGSRLEVVLPDDVVVAAEIPTTLAKPGQLEILGGDVVLATAADVSSASVRMDLMMVPSTLVDLRADAAERVKDYMRAEPGGKLVFRIDGEPIGWQSNQNPVAVGQVEISPDGGPDLDALGDRERWRAVAEWSVVIDHPLPCPVNVTRGP